MPLSQTANSEEAVPQHKKHQSSKLLIHSFTMDQVIEEKLEESRDCSINDSF